MIPRKKLIVPFALAILLTCVVLKCTGNGRQPVSQPTAKNSSESFDWSLAFPVRVYGKIEECAEGRCCIISNMKSRSRVSHYIYGNLAGELEKHKGRFALVIGKELPDPKNSWKKHLLVEKIDRISDESPKGFLK
ncbi:MAG: hypothetical protein N2316_10315 [Spirochaetes bacterium]|nr:hypothetical protein [Spirochaetota bacterium]